MLHIVSKDAKNGNFLLLKLLKSGAEVNLALKKSAKHLDKD
jgi:hypothetical protein